MSDQQFDYAMDCLREAIIRYEDEEKAEQGFGPLDTGWTSQYGELLHWWVETYGPKAVDCILNYEPSED